MASRTAYEGQQQDKVTLTVIFESVLEAKGQMQSPLANMASVLI